ncbi:MAG: hypothetical protein KFB95_03785 [Simkaniaceae bacterium]|nr:MAG: hypothetical protein KFB95_03785 [Simkaniaceae bacterium]
MRLFVTLLLGSVFILAGPIVQGRQYNLDYLLDFVESENDEGVKGVFLGGSAQRTVNYLLKKEGELPRHYDQEPSSSHGEGVQPDCDRDSWDCEY